MAMVEQKQKVKTKKQEAFELVEEFKNSERKWCMLLELFEENHHRNRGYGTYWNKCISDGFAKAKLSHEIITAAAARKRGIKIPDTITGQSMLIVKNN